MLCPGRHKSTKGKRTGRDSDIENVLTPMQFKPVLKKDPNNGLKFSGRKLCRQFLN